MKKYLSLILGATLLLAVASTGFAKSHSGGKSGHRGGSHKSGSHKKH